MTWDAVTAIASALSTVAFAMTALYVRDQLREQQKARYLQVTNDLFTLWQSAEFMEAQLWLIHKLEATTWRDFVARHRADRGEVALHRVGSFYDRVGTLVQMGFVDADEILSTIGGHAIAVWERIGPLVREARAIENSNLFDDFERLMPACRACYVPRLAGGLPVLTFAAPGDPVAGLDPPALKRRLDRGEPVTVLDVRSREQVSAEPPTLPGARLMPIDEVGRRWSELPADREVVAYCG